MLERYVYKNQKKCAADIQQEPVPGAAAKAAAYHASVRQGSKRD